MHCAHTRVADPRELKPNPRNPNKHPEAQLDLLAKVIAANGWRGPVVVSKRSGLVIKGHARLDVALRKRWATVPVDDQDYATEADEMADLVADNKIAELSESDDAEIAKILAEFGGENERFGLLADEDEDADEAVREIEVKAPPRMGWVLIGCPIEEFGRVQKFTEDLPAHFHVSTTSSDQGAPEEE